MPSPRSRAPSFGDLFAEITSSHQMPSDHPAIRWIDHRLTRPVRRLIFWIARTGWGTFTASLAAAVVAFLSAWISHKLTHWMGP